MKRCKECGKKIEVDPEYTKFKPKKDGYCSCEAIAIHPFPMHSKYYKSSKILFDEYFQHGKHLECPEFFEEIFTIHILGEEAWKGNALMSGAILNLYNRIRKLEDETNINSKS